MSLNDANRKNRFIRYKLYAAVLLCTLLLMGGCGESTQEEPPLAEVVYSQLSEEKVVLTKELPGRVSALVVAEVRPQVDGIIQERLFEEGAYVEQGQVLYRIDPAVYQAAHSTAKASLEEAEATAYSLAKLEARYRQLVKASAISQQELDNAIADHRQANARIARAKAELEAAAINLAYTQIKAPVSGRIGRSSVTPGALVTANQPEALSVIRQTSKVYVDITQSSAEMLELRRSIAQNKISQNTSSSRVRLTLEDGSPYASSTSVQNKTSPEWILGELLFSEISVGQSTGTVTIRAIFNNPEELLLPGMYVKAVIEEGSIENALLVPQGTVLSDGAGGHYVLVVEAESACASSEENPEESPEELFRLSRKDVQLDRASGNRWIIASGLAHGDRLVVEGLQKAAPGDIVKAVSSDSAPEAAPATVIAER